MQLQYFVTVPFMTVNTDVTSPGWSTFQNTLDNNEWQYFTYDKITVSSRTANIFTPAL